MYIKNPILRNIKLFDSSFKINLSMFKKTTPDYAQTHKIHKQNIELNLSK